VLADGPASQTPNHHNIAVRLDAPCGLTQSRACRRSVDATLDGAPASSTPPRRCEGRSPLVPALNRVTRRAGEDTRPVRSDRFEQTGLRATEVVQRRMGHTRRTGSGSPAARIRGGLSPSRVGYASKRGNGDKSLWMQCDEIALRCGPTASRLACLRCRHRTRICRCCFRCSAPSGASSGDSARGRRAQNWRPDCACGAHLHLGALADCGSDRVDALTSSYLCQRAGPTGPRPVERQYRIRRHGSQRPADLPPARRREALRLAPATARA